jgi:YegS/Rv2252/BmrU family lipid kinase
MSRSPTISSSTVFLVNPASGNGATGRRWPELARRASALGLQGDTLLSERPGHLIELAREAVDSGATLVVAVGGDGTLNEVVNGVVGRGVELASIPLGTGMDFGRTYDVPTKFEDAVRVALEGDVRTIDAGHVTYLTWSGETAERYFANVSSVGMSGAVAQRANGMSKVLGGKVTFFYALTRVFLEWQNTEVTVRLDDAERRGRMHDVIVANGVWHGGGMMLAPDAAPDDGQFDVVLIGDVSKIDFLTTAPKIYKGKHVHHPKGEVLRSRRVEVDAPVPLPIELEGEQVGTTPAAFSVVPGALRVRVPRA